MQLFYNRDFFNAVIAEPQNRISTDAFTYGNYGNCGRAGNRDIRKDLTLAFRGGNLMRRCSYSIVRANYLLGNVQNRARYT